MQGRFEVVREAGRGGQGRVVAVRDAARGGALVALKETPPRARDGLHREFALLARLRHPHLNPVYDWFPRSPLAPPGAPDPPAAYTQAWVEGPDLYTALRGADREARERVFLQVLRALAHLHALGVVHLDLKPDNVLVAGGAARVLDLGVAARAGERPEAVWGSRSYLAPERLAGAAAAPAADLYALGVMMAEVWLGAPPPPEADDGARRARLAAGGVPEAWLAAVAALTAPAPDRRPASVYEAAALWSRELGRPLALHTPETAAAVLGAGAPVGREEAVAAAAAAVRGGGAWRVGGAPGAGRRTVAREVAWRLQREGVPVEVWPGAPSVADARGLAAALERLAGVALPAPGAAAAGAGAADPAEEAAPLVRALLAAPPPAPRPVLVALEHAAAPAVARAALDGLLGAAAAGAPLPVGLLAVVEGDDADAALPPLDRTRVEALVAGRLGPRVATPRLVAALAASSGGHPHALEALLGLLVARGALRFGVEGWAVDPDAALEALAAVTAAGDGPAEALRGALAARVGLLAPALRDALGAVAWLRFPAAEAEVAAALGGAPGARLELDALAAAGLLWDDPGGRWRLAHPALAEAAAAWAPPGGAAAAHARAAAACAPGSLARAWHLGGPAGAAAARALAAAARAEGRLEDAAAAADVALELAPDDPETLALRADVADRLGPREVQVACLERLVAALPGGPARLQAARRLFWALTRAGEPARAEAAGAEVLALAERAGDAAVLAEALVDLANVVIQRGDYGRGEALLRRAEALAPSPGLRARVANNLGNVAAYRGEHAEALARYTRAYELKVEEGDPVGQRIALGNMGLMDLRLGRLAEALAHLAASWEAARRLGHRRGEAWSLLALGVLGLEAGALAYAERRLAAALAVAEALGDRVVACDARITLAELALAARDPAAARAHAEAGLAEAEAVGSGYNASGARAVLAAALAADEPARAAALAREAAEAEHAEPPARATAWRVLAGLAVARGELAEAGRAAEAAAAAGLEARPEAGALAEAARVLDLVGRGRRADEVRAAARRALAARARAWPDAPAADGVDGEAAVDGPCRAGFLAQPAVRALLGDARAPDGAGAPGGDARAAAPRGGEAMDGQDGWLARAAAADEAGLAGLLSAWLVDAVAEAGAERGFLVGADGEVLAARDADGDAVADAARKLPGAAAAQAREAGGPWRGAGAGERGALWAIPVAPGGALVLQNRFADGAFAGLDRVPAGAGRPGLLLRLLAAERGARAAAARADAAEAARREEAGRSTEEILRLRRELESTREQLGPARSYPRLVFRSGAMKRMLRRVDRLVDTDLPVSIQGESGTGKELVARALHELGPRAAGPFVAQNCGAIPAALFESEFFGHERGAFTGADRRTEGLFRRAHGGTLFLDEIGDLPLDLQAKLLRVLETGEVRPVGGQAVHRVDVRMVCATHMDLAARVAAGAFREDLFYRLDVVRVEVPPLRERPDDIPPLVEHFLARSPGPDGRPAALGPGVMRALVAYGWPGNVRQLENEVARAAVLCDGAITVADLSDEVRAATPGAPRGGGRDPLGRLGLDRGTLQERTDRLERLVLQDCLARTGGNKSAAARELGLSRAGLNMKLKRLGLW